ncbi:uncharacterized protein B0403.1-like [Haematobia irritans]|uniref:uncharacterized protein B0403.1-like n=1 Tax=Haematobia irritans TaxID=7368 RepID=UPI003F4FF1B6
MTFSRGACEQTEYCIGNYKLENVLRFNDLGVLLDSRLDFGPHIEECVNKAMGVLGFIKRWSKEFVDPYLTKRLFTTLVRPILEYACVVWSPSYRYYIDRVESVQKQFLIFALRGLGWNNLYDLPPYSSRLLLIDLPSLERRRFMHGIVYLTKLIKGDTDSHYLTSKICYNVPNRLTRNFVLLKTDFCRHNYELFNPLNVLSRNYNSVYTLFSLSELIPAIKEIILKLDNNVAEPRVVAF